MKSNEYITADTHFGHVGILKFGFRNIAPTVEEMDELLIARWNAKVPPNAFVYHLGDFAFAKKGRVIELCKRLNGHIRLVMGNHDQRVIKGAEIIAHFDWVRDYYESKTENNIKVCMSHYPFATWNKAHYGSWMFHGHSHGNLPDAGMPRIDVGIDTHPNYEPYSFEEILERMKGREYRAIDHHSSRKRRK